MMRYIILYTIGALLSACGGSGPSHPPAGTILTSSCNEYTLVETVANGSGGSTVRETERSPECGWNPPEAGTISEQYCEDYTQVTVYHDGEYGFYEEREEQSYDCGWEDPVAVFDVVIPSGDRFNPVVIEVRFEQFDEPYVDEDGRPLIIDWYLEPTDLTIGNIEQIDDYTIHIYGDSRVGEGVVSLNEEEFLYTIESEPTCSVDNQVDCQGYKQYGEPHIYYGEADNHIVTWELAVLLYDLREDSSGIAIHEEITFDPDSGSNDPYYYYWSRWLSRIDQYNAFYERSGVFVRYELKKLYLASWGSAESLESLTKNLPVDIALGYGTSYPDTCGVAYPNRSFIESTTVPTGMSRCTIKTDLHELGHSIGLAHGPNNERYAKSGYIFPQFGHGWYDLCGAYDGIMSYGYNDELHSNSKLTCNEIFDTTEFGETIAGGRDYADSAYSINRVRYNVSLVHDEHADNLPPEAETLSIETSASEKTEEDERALIID